MNAAAAQPPLWPSELTAWGTLAVAVAAVAVALFTEWRTNHRLEDARQEAINAADEERTHSAEALANQQAHSDSSS